MNHFALALSGGGFRGTLYHLGVVRFLHDADLLEQVTHITSVSGGSILGAHLALHWDRYCGSNRDFEGAAAEIIRFTQMDVRNRIVRRFPFGTVINSCRRLLRLGNNRRLTRAGLLEKYYEEYLYGEKCLHHLPERPFLHILSTNLSEGCLCSFNRNGLAMQKRIRGRRDSFESIKTGLATVAMAVAASSAFPGFFPPPVFRGWDVGADEGAFNQQAFTDGGVFDNLGVRFFRMAENAGVRVLAPLQRQDFLDWKAIVSALRSVAQLPEATPFSRLAHLLQDQHDGPLPSPEADDWEQQSVRLIEDLWQIITTHALYHDAHFDGITLSDHETLSLLHFARGSGKKRLDFNDHVWLNRMILQATLQQMTGQRCMRPPGHGFQNVFVSDAGREFKIIHGGSGSGLIRTAMRASDILMDRVWKLEKETFENQPGYTFASLSDIVSLRQDPKAPHPSIQQQTARIRTDVDAFSDLEVRALVQQGYCAARKACRSNPEVYGDQLPEGAPWNPMASTDHRGSSRMALAPSSPDETASPSDEHILETARKLRYSAGRRIWTTLLSLHDWPTYVWIPLLTVLLSALPWAYYQSHERAKQNKIVIDAITNSSPLYRNLLDILGRQPTTSLEAMPYEIGDQLPPRDFEGFRVIRDTRIIDLRGWDATNTAEKAPVYMNRSIRIRREANDKASGVLRLRRTTASPEIALRCDVERLKPKLIRYDQDGKFVWDLELNLSREPVGKDIDIVIVALVPEGRSASQTGWLSFGVDPETAFAKLWVLMPELRSFNAMELVSYEVGKPETARAEFPTNQLRVPEGSLVTFELVDPQQERIYQCHWSWQDK